MSGKEQTRVVWREDGRRSVQTYEPRARDMRPQATNHLTSDLRYQPLEHGGKCSDMFPLGFRVFDTKGRTAVYLPVQEFDEIENRPQEADGDGTVLRFELSDYGGDYDDDMPQEIRVTDLKRRSCVYRIVTVNSRAVDSKGFSIERDALGYVLAWPDETQALHRPPLAKCRAREPSCGGIWVGPRVLVGIHGRPKR